MDKGYLRTALCVLLFATLCAGVVSADDYVGGLPPVTVQDGVVSGGLWYDAKADFSNDETQTFMLPDYTDIAWARLYVGMYCGNMELNRKLLATVEFDGAGSGSYSKIDTLTEDQNKPYVFKIDGGGDAVTINGHCNRVTSDYLMWYDVKDRITSQNVGVKVNTAGSYDGRVKLIALVVAYNDGDGDEVYYWVNQGHDVHSHYAEENNLPYTGETTFDTTVLPGERDEEEFVAEVSPIYMASENGRYTFNRENLESEAPQSSLFGYQKDDVTDLVSSSDDCTFTYERTGSYYKIPLALLTVKYPEVAKGKIRVTSSPEGAKILIDDEEYGNTNSTVTDVAAGEHAVMVEHEEFGESEEEWVTIQKNETATVHFSFTGSLEISSEPGGAWVWLDGVNRSVRTETVLEDVVAGEHTITLKQSGYEDYTDEVEVPYDDSASFEAELVQQDTSVSGGDGSVSGYSYTGKELDLYKADTLNGSVAVFNAGSYTGLLEKGESADYILPVEMPANATVSLARLYLYSTWSHDEKKRDGVDPKLFTDFNGTTVETDRFYSDRKGNGTYDYVVGTSCYDVTHLIGGAGNYIVKAINRGGADDVFALYGATIVTVFEDDRAPQISYWLCEGCDALLASEAFDTTTEECTTTAGFEGEVNPSLIKRAELTVLSTAASGIDGEDNRVSFNEDEWFNLLKGGSSGISMATLDVLNSLEGSGNTAAIQSYIQNRGKGDYIENRNAILVLEHSGAPGLSSAVNISQSTPTTTDIALHEKPETFTLNFTGCRTSMVHITSSDGELGLHIREGTCLVDSSGLPPAMIGIEKQKTVAGDGSRSFNQVYSLTPAGVSADIPMVLSAPYVPARFNGTPGDSLTFAVFSENTSGWQNIETNFDRESSTLSCRIQHLGVYAIRAADVKGLPENPLSVIIDWIESLLEMVFGGTTAPEKTEAPPIANFTPQSTPEVTPVISALNTDGGSYDLFVSSNPEGALIYLEGIYSGKVTPDTLGDLPEGEHNIRLELDGFKPHEETVSVTGDTSRVIELFASAGNGVNRLKFNDVPFESGCCKSGGVYVTSRPEGAVIYVDGRKTLSVTPKVLYGLKQGKHRIKVKKGKSKSPVFERNQKEIWVYPDTISKVEFVFSERDYYQTVHVDSEDYKDAKFTVDGRYPERSFPAEVMLYGLNSYATLFINGSYVSHKLSDIAEGGKEMIEKRTALNSHIMVESDPAGADIFIDGYLTGRCTPYLIGNISDGRHLVSVSKPGYIPDEEEILLTGNPVNSEGIEKTLSFSLEPYVYGGLQTDSVPDGAKIYIYGKYTGEKTPHNFPYMEVGKYNLKMSGNGTKKTVDNVVVNPFEVTKSLVEL